MWILFSRSVWYQRIITRDSCLDVRRVFSLVSHRRSTHTPMRTPFLTLLSFRTYLPLFFFFEPIFLLTCSIAFCTRVALEHSLDRELRLKNLRFRTLSWNRLREIGAADRIRRHTVVPSTRNHAGVPAIHQGGGCLGRRLHLWRINSPQTFVCWEQLHGHGACFFRAIRVLS